MPSDKGKYVEPRGLEPLTPCLQSGGPGLVKRHSRLANREQAHPETLGRAFVAVVSCCRFGAQSVLVQRCEHCARFPSLPAASQSGSDHTARLRLQAWQPIMNPAERSRMRLKLRLALRLGWRDRGVNLNAVVMEAVGKEHWDRSHDPREAMVGGLARSGRVIFAAGAVMVAVFLTFALSGPLPPKEMGSSSASRCCSTRCSCG